MAYLVKPYQREELVPAIELGAGQATGRRRRQNGGGNNGSEGSGNTGRRRRGGELDGLKRPSIFDN